MTAHYVRLAPRAHALYHHDDDVSITADTVFDDGSAAEATGLLDAEGVPLYRVREHIKMGFCR